jgi:hypothetical protein
LKFILFIWHNNIIVSFEYRQPIPGQVIKLNIRSWLFVAHSDLFVFYESAKHKVMSSTFSAASVSEAEADK